jgi:DNA-binding MarR family transcriptional regulator
MDASERLLRLFREVSILQQLGQLRLLDALPDDLTEAQYGVLNHLAFTTHAAPRVGEMARAFHVTPSAMTQLVHRLRDAGYVELAPHPADSRARQVRMTPAGRRCFDAVNGRLAGDLARLARVVPPAELDALLEPLQRLRFAAEDLLREDPP